MHFMILEKSVIKLLFFIYFLFYKEFSHSQNKFHESLTEIQLIQLLKSYKEGLDEFNNNYLFKEEFLEEFIKMKLSSIKRD